MRTGRFRFRTGWFGKQILQAEYSHPMLIGGQVASDVRQRSWADANDVEAHDFMNLMTRHMPRTPEQKRALRAIGIPSSSTACPLDTVEIEGKTCWICKTCGNVASDVPGYIDLFADNCPKRDLGY